MTKTENTQQESETQAAAIERLTALLGIDSELLRSLIGHRIRGTATVGKDGSFGFTPQRECGPRQQKIKETRQGSLVRSLPSQEDGIYKLTVKSKPGSADPAADPADLTCSSFGSKTLIF